MVKPLIEERKTGDTEVVLARQLDAVLPVIERHPASAQTGS